MGKRRQDSVYEHLKRQEANLRAEHTAAFDRNEWYKMDSIGKRLIAVLNRISLIEEGMRGGPYELPSRRGRR